MASKNNNGTHTQYSTSRRIGGVLNKQHFKSVRCLHKQTLATSRGDNKQCDVRCSLKNAHVVPRVSPVVAGAVLVPPNLNPVLRREEDPVVVVVVLAGVPSKPPPGCEKRF